ncbi:MAG: CDP-alcohol phosphatidyltransferase family protein [Treponema sp.]|jgi:phosphatidylglycerophosphate synthase|nr:CDP-alcohol phosphatidyltransferase family protein [Treponema sp.]
MQLLWSLIGVVSMYFLGEAGVFFLLSRIYAFPGGFFRWFLAVHLIFQLIIAAFLLINRDQFYNCRSGERENRVNIANKITLFRISMLPFLIFLLLGVERYPGKNTGPVLVIAFALTFASDFIDGRLAKTRKIETNIGKILDSGSDYMLLGATAVSFFSFRLIKPWLFWIIMGRLFINALGMFILFLIRRKLNPQTTIFGKAAIAAIMVLFVFEAVPLAGILPDTRPGRLLPIVIWYLERGVCILILLSVIDKILYFIKSLRETRRADQSTDLRRQKEPKDPYREAIPRQRG